MNILVVSENDNATTWNYNDKEDVNFFFVNSFDKVEKTSRQDLFGIDAFIIDITKMKESVFERIKSYYFKYKEPPLVFYGGYHCTIDIYDVPHIYFCHNIHEGNKIEKIIKRIKIYVDQKIFCFTNNRNKYRLNYSEIEYIESDKRICHLYDKDSKRYDFYKKLDDVNQELGNGFLRCSKSFLVNKDYIEYSNSDKVILKDGKEFTITRKYGQNKKVQLIN